MTWGRVRPSGAAAPCTAGADNNIINSPCDSHTHTLRITIRMSGSEVHGKMYQSIAREKQPVLHRPHSIQTTVCCWKLHWTVPSFLAVEICFWPWNWQQTNVEPRFSAMKGRRAAAGAATVGRRWQLPRVAGRAVGDEHLREGRAPAGGTGGCEHSGTREKRQSGRVKGAPFRAV